MWFSTIQIENIRGFRDTGIVNLSRGLNVFVGANNAGKSTILSGLLKLQYATLGNLRMAANREEGKMSFVLGERITESIFRFGERSPFPEAVRELSVQLSDKNELTLVAIADAKTLPGFEDLTSSRSTEHLMRPFPEVEPDNVLYPFVSRRKVSTYDQQVSATTANSVLGHLGNLPAKINRLAKRYAKGHDYYHNACMQVFGYPVSTTEVEKGMEAGYGPRAEEFISLTDMGEGTSNLLGLIVALSNAENKIFVIEEPENDVHPRALKAILKLIEEAAQQNQFFISTHSNIVVKHLGSLSESKLFEVKMKINGEKRLPDSTIREVSQDPEERRALLEDLGYDFFDFGLWEGWLFFEESSAEEVVRDAIFPLFFPQLQGRVRTFGKGGKDGVQQRFDDFNHLFSFLHLTPAYKNKAWVFIDGGEDERKVLQKLKDNYMKNGWEESHFKQFSEHDFEKYYPVSFQEKVAALPGKQDRKERIDAKGKLAKELVEWAKNNRDQARNEFAESANEVIDMLKPIASVITRD